MLCSWGDHDWLLEKEITRRENEATTQGQNTGRRVPCVRPPWMATETREQLRGAAWGRQRRCWGGSPLNQSSCSGYTREIDEASWALPKVTEARIWGWLVLAGAEEEVE